MTRNEDVVLIYATAPDVATAETLGTALLDQRLAACINILPGMVSLYEWQGKRQRDQEVVMIAKTRASLAERAVEAIRAVHPYDTPAILVLPVAAGAAGFIGWIAGQTADPRA